jgi:hypothetical protein
MLPPALFVPVDKLSKSQKKIKLDREGILSTLDKVITSSNLNANIVNTPAGQEMIKNLPENVGKMLTQLENHSEVFAKLKIVASSGQIASVDENDLKKFVEANVKNISNEEKASLYYTRHTDVYHMALNLLSICSQNTPDCFDITLIGKSSSNEEVINLQKNTLDIMNSIIKPSKESIEKQKSTIKSRADLDIEDGLKPKVFSDEEVKAMAGYENLNKLIQKIFPAPRN